MLRRLLSLIVEGEMTSLAECAEKLGVSVDTLDDMLERLVALGYVENASASCASAFSAASSCGGCKGCSMAGSCHGGLFAGRKGIAWQVTAQGRAAADASAPVDGSFSANAAGAAGAADGSPDRP